MTVAVVTDSAASLAPDTVITRPIEIVPMGLVVGGVVYPDGQLEPAELLERAAHETVSTSAPSPGDFAKGVTAAGGEEGAVVVTVSSGMSASFAAARLAAGLFDPGAVEVVDSGTAAGGQGLVALAAADAAAAGAGVAEVAAAARLAASRVRLLASLESLDYLARSGRVPSLVGRASGSLGLNMLFELSGGRVRPHAPAFGTEAALSRIERGMARADRPGRRLQVAVLDAEAPSQAEALSRLILDRHPGADLFRAPFSSVMVAHTGPGLVGAAWWSGPGPMR